MCWSGSTREPSSATTRPSTRTQPFAIHSSASRRDAMPSWLIRFDSRSVPSAGADAEVALWGRNGGDVRVRPGTWGFGAGPRRGVFRAVGSRPVSIGSRRDGAFARGSNRGSGCRAVRSEARSAVGSVARLAVGRVMRSGARPAVRSETRSAARLAVRSVARSAARAEVRSAARLAVRSVARSGGLRVVAAGVPAAGRGSRSSRAVRLSGAAAAAGTAGTDASRSVRSAWASFSVGRERFACPRTGARFGDGPVPAASAGLRSFSVAIEAQLTDATGSDGLPSPNSACSACRYCAAPTAFVL